MEVKDIEIIENKKDIVNTENYKEIAIHYLESTGNLQKFSESEKNQFIDICSAYGLNPIKKEVYGVKYGNNFNIIVSADFYLKRASRTGLLDGFKTEVANENGVIKAICTIYRKDWTHPFIHEVYLDEYNQHNSMWEKKPITMIKKVAEAQAFRKCFPEDLGGIPYIADELPDDMNGNLKDYPTDEQRRQERNEQLNKIKEMLSAHYADGSEIFTEEDKSRFREEIKQSGINNTFNSVNKEINNRIENFMNNHKGE